MSNNLLQRIVDARKPRDELLVRARDAGPEHAVLIRVATPADAAALRRLAERDSSPLPSAPLVVAEVGGELRAAVSIADGQSVADPFHRTAELAALAELRAAQFRSVHGGMRLVARMPRPAPQAARGTA